MGNERIHASVWLRLRPFEEAKLDRVIRRPADRHHTHRFLPHLTVCGPTLDPSSLDAAARYARTSGLLPLTVAVARISFAVGNPFEAVFVEIATNPGLHEFREEMRRITRAGPLGPPHVSLFYAVDRHHAAVTVEAGELEEMGREARRDVDDLEYVLERPAVAYAGAGGSWFRVSEWNVRDL